MRHKFSVRRKFMVGFAIASLCGGAGWQVAAAASSQGALVTPSHATSAPSASVFADSVQAAVPAGNGNGGNCGDCCNGKDNSTSNGNDGNCCNGNVKSNGNGNDGGCNCQKPKNNGPSGCWPAGITTGSSSCQSGKNITVNGTNFVPDESITLTLKTNPSKTYTVESNGQGSFSTSIQVSAIKTGEYVITATDGAGDSTSTDIDIKT